MYRFVCINYFHLCDEVKNSSIKINVIGVISSLNRNKQSNSQGLFRADKQERRELLASGTGKSGTEGDELQNAVNNVEMRKKHLIKNLYGCAVAKYNSYVTKLNFGLKSLI